MAAVDHLTDVVLQKFRERIVEAPQRHERAGFAAGHRLGRFLKPGKHGALAAGEVLARIAVDADLLEHVAHEVELVFHERVRLAEIFGSTISHQVGARIFEGEQVLQHRRLRIIGGVEQRGGRVGFIEHATLDDLVDARRRQRQARVEAPLDLREIVAGNLRHLVDGFLAGDHHPHAPAALRTEVLDDGLQVQHQVHVRADELSHLVHHEQQAELPAHFGGAGIGVRGNLIDQVFRRDGGIVIQGTRLIARLLLGPVEHLLQGFNQIVLEKVDLVAGVLPCLAVDARKRCTELIGFPLLGDMFL